MALLERRIGLLFAAFLALAGLSLVGAVTVALVLPREKGFVRSPGLLASARQMLRHLKDPQLLATYGIGFGVLFNFIATFTYLTFHLASPPFNRSPAFLGYALQGAGYEGILAHYYKGTALGTTDPAFTVRVLLQSTGTKC